MVDPPETSSSQRALQPARSGAGPLYQRDYWAVIDRCRYRPSEVMALVAEKFCELPPEDMVMFERSGGATAPLKVGDEFDIRIRMAGACLVRVMHMDACSMTFATLEGHPEAGRITFGAYRNDEGNVVFHIRSRARSSSRTRYFGFRTGGDPMQTTTWTDFVNNVALTCGEGVIGVVRAETVTFDAVTALDEADDAMDRPTYRAKGD